MPQWYENCFTALHPLPWTGNHCSQIVHDRSRGYCWHYVSLALEDDLGDPMNLMPWWATNTKSSSCCSRLCSLCHHTRDTSTNKTNICPVMRTSPTLSSSNTWNPLGVGTEKKLQGSIYIQELSCQKQFFIFLPTAPARLALNPHRKKHWRQWG